MKTKASLINLGLPPTSLSIVVSLFCVLVITFLSLSPCLRNGFTNWDDPDFVVKNETIRDLSPANLKNIISQVVVKNWHPLTMLSYSVEYHFFKLNPLPYHITNLVLHLLNTALVFWLVVLLVGDKRVALLTSLLFGIHPMHVESVAWIAERKDVLFAFFFLGSLISYLYYLKRNEKALLLVFAFILFMFSILSKITALSLPIILVLIDFFLERRINLKAVIEKIPFFILSLIAGIIILSTHHDVISLRGKFVYDYTILERFFLSNYGLFMYVLKLFWPYQLSALYPYPEKTGQFFSPIFYLSSLFIIAIIAAIFILPYKTHKRLFIFCTLFFFYTIFANLPFSVIGEAVIADRYIYIPCIGLFILISAIFFSLLNSKAKWALAFVFAIYCLWLSVITFNQCRVWKDGITLWTDVIKKNPTLGFAYFNRGVANSHENNHEAAVSDFTQVIKQGPVYLALDAYTNRGEVFALSGQYDHAVEDLTRVLEINPRAYAALNNRGLVYIHQKKYNEALKDFDQAIHFRPEFVDAYNNRGVAHMLKRDFKPALSDFHRAVSLNVRYAPAYYNMSKIYFTLKDMDKAKQSFVKAISLGYKPEGMYSAIMESLLKTR